MITLVIANLNINSFHFSLVIVALFLKHIIKGVLVKRDSFLNGVSHTD